MAVRPVGRRLPRALLVGSDDCHALELRLRSALLKATKPGDGHTSAHEKARVKEFWDGILQEDEEDEPAPKKAMFILTPSQNGFFLISSF